MLWLMLFAYLFSLAVVLLFSAGASILNEHWDRESERALRYITLFPAA